MFTKINKYLKIQKSKKAYRKNNQININAIFSPNFVCIKKYKNNKKAYRKCKKSKTTKQQTQTNQSNQTQPSLSRPQNNKITESNFT